MFCPLPINHTLLYLCVLMLSAHHRLLSTGLFAAHYVIMMQWQLFVLSQRASVCVYLLCFWAPYCAAGWQFKSLCHVYFVKVERACLLASIFNLES